MLVSIGIALLFFIIFFYEDGVRKNFHYGHCNWIGVRHHRWFGHCAARGRTTLQSNLGFAGYGDVCARPVCWIVQRRSSRPARRHSCELDVSLTAFLFTYWNTAFTFRSANLAWKFTKALGETSIWPGQQLESCILWKTWGNLLDIFPPFSKPLTFIPLSLLQTMRCLRDGCLARTTASTNMNSTSSRSHAVFTLFLHQKWKVSEIEGYLTGASTSTFH